MTDAQMDESLKAASWEDKSQAIAAFLLTAAHILLLSGVKPDVAKTVLVTVAAKSVDTCLADHAASYDAG